MRRSLVGSKRDESKAVKTATKRAMGNQTETPTQKAKSTKDAGKDRSVSKGPVGPEQEKEACLDSFLDVLEYLSGATGLAIEDIADLLAGKEGAMGAIILSGHLQALTSSKYDGQSEL
jgi:hypothetical protein